MNSNYRFLQPYLGLIVFGIFLAGGEDLFCRFPGHLGPADVDFGGFFGSLGQDLYAIMRNLHIAPGDGQVFLDVFHLVGEHTHFKGR